MTGLRLLGLVRDFVGFDPHAVIEAKPAGRAHRSPALAVVGHRLPSLRQWPPTRIRVASTVPLSPSAVLPSS